MERWYEALPMLHLEIYNRYETSLDVATGQVMTLVWAEGGSSIIL